MNITLNHDLRDFRITTNSVPAVVGVVANNLFPYLFMNL